MNAVLSFRDVAERWQESKRTLVKHSSYCVYVLTLNTHLLPVFGDSTEIDEVTVQKFVIDKLNSGLSRKSVKDILAVLKAVVKFGARYFAFPGPVWEIVFPTDTRRRVLPVLSLSHQRRLLQHLTQNPSPQNIGVLISLCTGMRIGEVCALQWSDVDLTRRVITVGQTVHRIYNYEIRATERLLSSPKTRNSNREIPIAKHLFTALSFVKRTASGGVYVVGCRDIPKEPRTYREFFARLLHRLDIPGIVFHGLRHTFATRCIECQCDYKTVSVILGHSNVSTTLNLYVHPNLDQKKRCMDKFTKAMGLE